VSDSRIISVLAITIAVNLESKLPVVPVRLKELQFCMLKLSGAGERPLAAPAARWTTTHSAGFFCNV
jgi:hypothetical protein